MLNLPLFPLNTVLFPGIPFRLHIFEERYKEMISRCVDRSEPFGVVLIKQGREALGPVAEPHPVGCTAQIIQLEQLPEGRFNITVVGQDRFRILSLSYDRPYLVGQVELRPFAVDDPGEVHSAGERLRPLVNRYLEILTQATDEEIESPQLPERPLELACLAAHILQTPLTRKQDLLAEDEALGLISGLTGLYPGEIALLQTIIEQSDPEQGTLDAFSVN